MKYIIGLVITLFVYTQQASAQEIQHGKLKKVYVGAIMGSVYGYLNWDKDVETALKDKSYSTTAIQKIQFLTAIENHPTYLKTDELFFANKLFYHNFTCYEVVSFERYESTSGRDLKYKLLWIPFGENQQQPEGIKPTDVDGFYVIMHNMSVKGKQDVKTGLTITTLEDIEAKKAEARKRNEQEAMNAERIKNTYTVTFILEKVSSNIISASVYYSAVFVEVYDVNGSRNEVGMKNAAEMEFQKNVQLNGYQVYKTFFDNMPASSAQSKVKSSMELSDTRTYRIDY